MAKKFMFYDNVDSQFIDTNMNEKLNEMRPHVVEEMIGLRKEYDNGSLQFVLFLYMKQPEHKDASVLEIAAGMYTEKFRKNIRYAVNLARTLVHNVNHWKENKCVRVHSLNHKYKSIPSVIAYEPIEAIQDMVATGCSKTKREDKQILAMPLKTRRKMAQKVEADEIVRMENRRARGI